MSEIVGYEEFGLDEVSENGDISLEEFWKRAEERDYLTAADCEMYKIKYVRLQEFLRVKKINENKLGLVFRVKILNGDWKGKEKTLTVYDSKARKLAEEFGTKDVKQWVGGTLVVTIDGSGKFRKMNFTKYEPIGDEGAKVQTLRGSKPNPSQSA